MPNATTPRLREVSNKSGDPRVAELESDIALLEQNADRLNDRIARADNLADTLVSLGQYVADSGDSQIMRKWLDVVDAVCCRMSQILNGAADTEKEVAQ